MATTADFGRTALTRRGVAERRAAWRKPETRTALLFLLPSFIGFLVFYAIPAVRGFYLSFTDWDLLKQSGDWVGIDNYRAMLQDALFWNALGRTAEYVIINIGIQTVLALGIAVLMHRLTRSIVVRGIIVLPWLIPNVVLALLWMWMLDPNLGIVPNVPDPGPHAFTCNYQYDPTVVGPTGDTAVVSVQACYTNPTTPDTCSAFGSIPFTFPSACSGTTGTTFVSSPSLQRWSDSRDTMTSGAPPLFGTRPMMRWSPVRSS